jgi:hypothetical protein
MGPFDPTQAHICDGRRTWRTRCSSRPVDPMTALQDSSFGVLGGMLGSRSRFGYFRLQKTGRGPSRQKMSVSE